MTADSDKMPEAKYRDLVDYFALELAPLWPERGAGRATKPERRKVAECVTAALVKLKDKPYPFENTRSDLATPPPPDSAVREALILAGKRFRFYEQQHKNKTPPDMVKAENNAEYAEMCERALQAAAPKAQDEGEVQATDLDLLIEGIETRMEDSEGINEEHSLFSHSSIHALIRAATRGRE